MPTFTLAPVVVNVATNAVTFVPYGMVTAMVFAVSFIVPVALLRENAVMAFVELSGAGLLLLPPHPATKTTISNAKQLLVKSFFMCVPSFLIPHDCGV